MFDPKKSYNELPFLPPKVDFKTIKIMEQLMKSKVELAKLDTLTKNKLDNKNIFLEPFALRESVESSQIENINTTLETTYKSEYETNINPEQKETLAYKDALMHGFNTIIEKGFLSINHILEIGKILSPGKGIKRTTVGVNISKSSWAGTEVLYTPPIGNNIKGDNAIDSLLNNLEVFFNTPNTDIDPLIQMALLHYQFEAIHPFYDGNGRTGRVLMMLHLINNNQLCYPILFLSGFINQTKNDYYELLRNVTAKGEWEEYVLYILKAIEVQSRNTVETIEKLITYGDNLRKKLSEIDNLKSKDAEVILDLLGSKTFFSMNDLKEKSGVSINTVTKLFKIIVNNGLGVEKKIGQNKVIFNKDFLDIFDK